MHANILPQSCWEVTSSLNWLAPQAESKGPPAVAHEAIRGPNSPHLLDVCTILHISRCLLCCFRSRCRLRQRRTRGDLRKLSRLVGPPVHSSLKVAGLARGVLATSDVLVMTRCLSPTRTLRFSGSRERWIRTSRNSKHRITNALPIL